MDATRTGATRGCVAAVATAGRVLALAAAWWCACGTAATPPVAAPVTSAVAHSFERAAPPAPAVQMPATPTGTRPTGSAPASPLTGPAGVTVVTLERIVLRARFSSARTAPW